MSNNYSIQDIKKFPIILNMLGREGLQLMKALNDQEQETLHGTLKY